MSFLKQLLNPFIEFDENKKPETVNAPLPQVPAVKPAEVIAHPLITNEQIVGEQQAAAPGSPLREIGDGPLPEHIQYFEKLIDKANKENPIFSGTDYKEFIDAKMDIDDINDENLKYTTAFNILKSSGLDKDKLLATGQKYLNLIGRDLNAFQTAHAQQYKKELQQKETNLKNKAEELQALSQRINVLKSEINQITTEISHSKEKLNNTKKSFLLAGENKQAEIQTELNKISKYFD